VIIAKADTGRSPVDGNMIIIAEPRLLLYRQGCGELP
jgi:hypothetical protein